MLAAQIKDAQGSESGFCAKDCACFGQKAVRFSRAISAAAQTLFAATQILRISLDISVVSFICQKHSSGCWQAGHSCRKSPEISGHLL
jgi:hypothetical protein